MRQTLSRKPRAPTSIAAFFLAKIRKKFARRSSAWRTIRKSELALFKLSPDGKVLPVVPVPPLALLPEVTQAMEKVLSVVWPGVPLVRDHVHRPLTVSTRASPASPTYGISCMFFDKNDNREHGKDERVGVQDFSMVVGFGYKLMKNSLAALRSTLKK